MSIYMPCPREKCEGEVCFRAGSDSDDFRSWAIAEAESDICTEGHELTADEWDAIQDEANEKAADYWRTWEPPGL